MIDYWLEIILVAGFVVGVGMGAWEFGVRAGREAEKGGLEKEQRPGATEMAEIVMSGLGGLLVALLVVGVIELVLLLFE